MSTDFNLIEHIWNEVKRMLEKKVDNTGQISTNNVEIK